ncbi:hypothetical protein [Erwinia pyrifoliae]|uniref:hypothetical protein n=1 Tax=Erwinia pyrifoliae TaxID=79967 RepID=UPI00223BF41C|nr:hypothetical protein [Erwinia pyrifoliae]MCT2388865.1 hypothetical protein [Erwinia pyrifoliae]MCU8589059.1 hypothetical protein [Erwinia pyrifoliae]
MNRLFLDFRFWTAFISFLIGTTWINSVIHNISSAALAGAFLSYLITCVAIGFYKRYITTKRNALLTFNVYINQVKAGEIPGAALNVIRKEAYTNSDNWTEMCLQFVKCLIKAVLWVAVLAPIAVYWGALIMATMPETFANWYAIFTASPRTFVIMSAVMATEIMFIAELLLAATGLIRFGYHSPFSEEINDRLRRYVGSQVIGEVEVQGFEYGKASLDGIRE